MKLIVGLGNKGKDYELTRHNIGFMVIDEFMKKNKIGDIKSKNNGLYFESYINGEKIIFLKPQLYMNLSGIVVKSFIDFYKISIKDVLIISDDIDMDLGKIRLRKQGSAGGHNGLKNIEDNLKTKNYRRLKIGTSKNIEIETKNFVLSKFSKEELLFLEEIINRTVNIVEDFITIEFEELMNKYN